MKCGERERTATSPLRRLNSLHHQQHFINNRRLAEQKESSPQTQIDARTIVLLLLLRSERLQQIQKKPSHTTAKTQTTHTRPSCALGRIAATPSRESVTTFLRFQVVVFFLRSLNAV